MLSQSSHEQDPSSDDSFFEMNERGQKGGGEREREIEFSERVCGRAMEETRGGTMNIKVKT